MQSPTTLGLGLTLVLLFLKFETVLFFSARRIATEANLGRKQTFLK